VSAAEVIVVAISAIVIATVLTALVLPLIAPMNDDNS